MPIGCIVRPVHLFAVTLFLVTAHDARAELTPWDQARVTEAATELVTATEALYDTFYHQPRPSMASLKAAGYYEIKQYVRLLRIEARQLVRSLEEGEGREETLPIFRNLMQLTRSAREEAVRVFIARDVGERATAVREVLNQLGPYYDPDFPMLAPHPNIEPSTRR